MTAPRPPSDLARRTPLLATLAAGARLHRFFSAAYDPLYFDHSDEGRFNAVDGSYGVLYAAQDVQGAFAETFLRTPGKTLIARDLLSRKAYVELTTTRTLRLVRLAGRGLAVIGATAEVSHGGLPYDVPRSWSSALHAHPAAADGIAYTARHDDEQLCYALFDRAADAIEERRRATDLDIDWFWQIADVYGVGLAP